MSPRRRCGGVVNLATTRRHALTVAELAGAWEVTEGTVRKWIRSRVLRAFRVGRLLRVRRAEAVRFERDV